MTNSNCLAGFRCPECGHEDKFIIDAQTTFDVTDDGTGDHQDVEWDDDSSCTCGACNHSGMVIDFQIDTQDISPAVKCLPLDTVAPDAFGVARRLGEYLISENMTADGDEAERQAGIKDLIGAMVYTSNRPFDMCLYLERMCDWRCDEEIYAAFRLLPHFMYVARRAERVIA